MNRVNNILPSFKVAAQRLSKFLLVKRGFQNSAVNCNEKKTIGDLLSRVTADPGTTKLAKWLDVGIITRQGRAFDASNTLMSITDENAVILPRFIFSSYLNHKNNITLRTTMHNQLKGL